jgi:hypothetical protein
VVFRGAYAGEGTNPGWKPQADIKAPRAPAPNPTPTLVWISPPTGQRGIPTTVTLTGANFTPGATVAVSGSGVKIGAVTVDSATQITATLTIAPTAEPGTRNISVSTRSGGSNAVKFQIHQRQAR